MKVIYAVMNTTWAVVKIRPEKKFRPVRDLNPWPLRYRCSALPTELTSQHHAVVKGWINECEYMKVIYFVFTSLSAVQIYDFPNILIVGEIRFTATSRAVLTIPTSWLYDRIEENFIVLAYVCYSHFAIWSLSFVSVRDGTRNEGIKSVPASGSPAKLYGLKLLNVMFLSSHQ